MSDQDLFLGYIKAYNARDVSRMVSFFGENCVFENISAGKVTARTQGKAELEAIARRSADAFSSREQRVRTLSGKQGWLVAEIEYSGVLRADLPPDLKAGDRLELRGISVFEFSGGKIVRLSDYS